MSFITDLLRRTDEQPALPPVGPIDERILTRLDRDINRLESAIISLDGEIARLLSERGAHQRALSALSAAASTLRSGIPNPDEDGARHSRPALPRPAPDSPEGLAHAEPVRDAEPGSAGSGSEEPRRSNPPASEENGAANPNRSCKRMVP